MIIATVCISFITIFAFELYFTVEVYEDIKQLSRSNKNFEMSLKSTGSIIEVCKENTGSR